MQISSATLPMCGNSEQISWPGFAELLEVMLRAEAGQALALQLRDLLALGEGIGHRLAVSSRRVWACSRRFPDAMGRPPGRGRSRAWPWPDGAADSPRPVDRQRGARSSSEFEASRPEAGDAVAQKSAAADRLRSVIYVPQLRVMVSCRFRMARATMVMAASSAGRRPRAAPRPRSSVARPFRRRAEPARFLAI